MTPTIPLPALVRSVSLLMYPKSWVNELMLRSDGTVAGEAGKHCRRDEFGEPQSGSLLFKCYLLPSSRRSRGESAPATRYLLSGPWRRRRRAEHCSGWGVCQEIVKARGKACPKP